MSLLHQRIWEVVRIIPRGCVATYGQVAALAGLSGQARLVGYALHSAPKDLRLPWHRVINAKGQISFPRASVSYREQARLLTDEGVAISRRRIDLQIYGWNPHER